MSAVSSSVVVRVASDADLPALVLMAQHFLASTSYGASIPSDEAAVRERLALMRSIGTVLMATSDDVPVGMIGGAVYPHFLTGIRTASEAWWWVEPSARGGRIARDLLDAFAAWAKNQGATRLEIGSRHERLDRFYQRLGFAPVERIFVKDLT